MTKKKIFNILLLKNNFIKGTNILTKDNNPHVDMKNSTSDYENILKNLDAIKLNKVENKVAKSNK